MKRIIAFSVFWLGLLLCSSRGTDLFHITADEQLAKFQELFRSLFSDKKAVEQIIPLFLLGKNQKEKIKLELSNNNGLINSLTPHWRNMDTFFLRVKKEC